MKNVYIAVDDFTGVLDFMSVFGPVDFPPPPTITLILCQTKPRNDLLARSPVAPIPFQL